MKGKLLALLFGPFFLLYMLYIIKTYNYKFDVTGWRRFISYHGVNLQFLKMNRRQWNVFSKKLAPRYFKIAAILNLLINLFAFFFISDNQIYAIFSSLIYLFLLITNCIILFIKIRKIK